MIKIRLLKSAVMIFFVVFTVMCVCYQCLAEEKNLTDCRYLISYRIKAGDTLSGIAGDFNVSLADLMKINKLSGTLIKPGEIVIIPGRENGFSPTFLTLGSVFRDDVMLLAKAIYAEARGESFTGQVAVGAVILNRVDNSSFPKSVKDVIMQSNDYVYQFTPVANGSINLTPDETAVNAAIQAVLGEDPTGGALFFYNPEIASDRWIRNLPVIGCIGNHVFAKKV
ncbi:MAG: cell wall hydrolase [Eubacteriales bacterium]